MDHGQKLSELVKQEIKLNITAIFTLDQIKEIIEVVKDSNSILSIFSEELRYRMNAGKIYRNVRFYS